jgi:hypothetical protein
LRAQSSNDGCNLPNVIFSDIFLPWKRKHSEIFYVLFSHSHFFALAGSVKLHV